MRTVLLAILIAALAVFWGWNLARNANALRSYQWSIAVEQSLLATVALALAFCLLPLNSRQVLRALGHDVPYTKLFRLYFLSQMAKYLPGGIWVIPGRVIAYRQIGVDLTTATLSILVELLFLIISGTIAFLLGPALLWLSAENLPYLVIGVIPPMLVLHPGIFNALLQFVLRTLRQPRTHIRFTRKHISYILGIDLAFWYGAGLAFYLLVRSVEAKTPLALAPFLVGVLSISWVIGFLVFVVPAGIGPRESAMLLLLTPIIPPPLPVMIPVLARLWWLLGESLCILAIWIVGRSKPT